MTDPGRHRLLGLADAGVVGAVAGETAMGVAGAVGADDGGDAGIASRQAT